MGHTDSMHRAEMRLSLVLLLFATAGASYFSPRLRLGDDRLCQPKDTDTLSGVDVKIDAASHLKEGQQINMELTGKLSKAIDHAGNLTVEWYYNQILIERVVKPACTDTKGVCKGAPVPFCNALCPKTVGPVDLKDSSLKMDTPGQYQAIMQVVDTSGRQLV